ncbi:MAG: ABC transporter substrate-binding protein, partial [Ahrensia sp.]|nr:ABC transporter substrate-binding protein [Ahrensia sp.]
MAQWLAEASTGAVAREVIEREGEASMQTPVGTGPFVLREWRAASRIVLERNPRATARCATTPNPLPTTLRRRPCCGGCRVAACPMIDRVEVAIIEEKQPTWLAFLNNETDWVELPDGFLSVAMPGGRLAPNLNKRGIRAAIRN